MKKQVRGIVIKMTNENDGDDGIVVGCYVKFKEGKCPEDLLDKKNTVFEVFSLAGDWLVTESGSVGSWYRSRFERVSGAHINDNGEREYYE